MAVWAGPVKVGTVVVDGTKMAGNTSPSANRAKRRETDGVETSDQGGNSQRVLPYVCLP